MPPSLLKHVPCVLKYLPIRNSKRCRKAAAYSAEFFTDDGRSFVLELCSAHLPKAFSVAQIYIDRHFEAPGHCAIRVQFHQLKRGYVSKIKEMMNQGAKRTKTPGAEPQATKQR